MSNTRQIRADRSDKLGFSLHRGKRILRGTGTVRTAAILVVIINHYFVPFDRHIVAGGNGSFIFGLAMIASFTLGDHALSIFIQSGSVLTSLIVAMMLYRLSFSFVPHGAASIIQAMSAGAMNAYLWACAETVDRKRGPQTPELLLSILIVVAMKVYFMLGPFEPMGQLPGPISPFWIALLSRTTIEVLTGQAYYIIVRQGYRLELARSKPHASDTGKVMLLVNANPATLFLGTLVWILPKIVR